MKPPVKKILLASANPYSFCIAFEQHMARTLGAEHQVDALNLYELAARHSPFYGPASRLIVAANRKFERFLLPELSGRDITDDIVLDDALPPMPATERELRDYTIGDAKVGIGVLSSMVSLTTIQNPVSLDEYGPGLKAAWKAAHRSLAAGEAVKALGYDEVYIFNGRHCYARPFCDVLQNATKLQRYEVGGSEDTTTYIYADRSLHDPTCFAAIIQDHDVDPAAGEAFFTDRVNRAQGNEVVYFTGLQTPGHIPEELQGTSFVTFFTSSSDERFASLGENSLGAFKDQFEVAKALATICAEAGKRLVVRLHPHLRFKHESWKREWDFEALRARGVMVIEPADICDSYALAQASHCVITGGSTVSFECSFLGVPNAAVGDCLPGRMGASVVCDTAADLAAFIAAPKLPDHARRQAIVYGSYNRVGGIPLPGYEMRGHLSKATLHGRILDPVRYVTQPVRNLFGF